MKKKVLATLLAAVLALSLAGCNSSSANDSKVQSGTKESETNGSADAPGDTDAVVETKPFKVTTSMGDSGTTAAVIGANNLRKLAEVAGGEIIFEPTTFSPDAIVAFVENQIAAGVDGIIFIPPADSVLPTITTLCEEAGVYWGIIFRSILDDEIREMVEASPYYVGNCYENEVETGYRVMSNLNDMGMKKVAIISTVKGDTTGDQREEGIARACEEFGMEVVAEARGLAQASDATSAAESFLSAYNDLDCIFVVGTTATGAHEAVVKAIQDAGRSDTVKMATIDFPDTMDALFETGVLVTSSGLPHLFYDPYMTAVKVFNTVMGTPIEDTCFSSSITMFDISSQEQAGAWLKTFGSDDALYYTDEEIRQLLKAYNTDLDAEAFQAIIDNFNPVK